MSSSILHIRTEEDGKYKSLDLSWDDGGVRFDAGNLCLDFCMYQLYLCSDEKDEACGSRVMYSSSVDDFFGDTEEDYIFRYVNTETMNFLTNEQILITPMSMLNKTLQVVARSGHRNMRELREYVENLQK